MNGPIFLILLIVSVFFETSHGASAAEEQGDLQRFQREVVDRQYVPIFSVADSRELDVITRNLDSKVWPILPTSHRFEQRDKKWCITKHRDAPGADLHLYAFGEDAPQSVNYVVQSYGRTTYSYAQTLKDDCKFCKNKVPFVVEQISYMDGHCIDHRDTRPEKLGNYYWQNSSTHSTNHIPEPPGNYWGLTCRNALVKDFRKRLEGYSQWVFYPSKPLLTTKKIPIPMGVLFMQHEAESWEIINGWSIPWADSLHRSSADEGHYLTQLRKYTLNHHSQSEARKDLLGIRDRFFPKTFVYEKGRLDEKIFGRALKVPETLDNPYSQFSLYRMETLADEEIVPSWSPATFGFFLDQMERHKGDPYFREKTDYWQKRFTSRSESLRKNDFSKIMAGDVAIDTLIQKVQRAESFDADDRVQDHLRQLKSHSEVKQEPAAAPRVGPYEDYERPVVVEVAAVAPQVEPSRPLKITFGTGKGSLETLKSPLHEDEFRFPRNLSLEITERDPGSITRKVSAWTTANKRILEVALSRGTITEFRIVGNISSVAQKELRILFGSKFKEN